MVNCCISLHTFYVCHKFIHVVNDCLHIYHLLFATDLKLNYVSVQTVLALIALYEFVENAFSKYV